MGTVMLCYVEKMFFRRDDILKQNGVWVSLDKWIKNEDAVLYPERKHSLWHTDWGDLVYTGGGYRLHAILANQRNAYIEIPYISKPRGLPNDVSEEIRQEFECGESHTCTWFTFDEIFEFNWDQKIEYEDYTMDNELVVDVVDYSASGEEFLKALKRLVHRDPSHYRVVIMFHD